MPTRGQSSDPDTGFAASAPVAPSSLLDLLRYDPKMQGPLFVLSNSPSFYALPTGASAAKARERVERKTPAQFAEGFDGRVITAGNVSTLVPQHMNVIPGDPGKADPFAGLRPAERLQILLSLLTRAQWDIAGSPTGIGAGDLTDAQRSLFQGLLPSEPLAVRTYRQEKGAMDSLPGPDGKLITFPRFVPQGDPELFPIDSIRLRLVRRTRFDFLVPGGVGEEESLCTTRATDRNDAHRVPQSDGSVILQEVENGAPDSPSPEETSFGVSLIRTVENRPKPGQLDLDTPALAVPMRFDGTAKTVGELLAQIASVTHLDLVADRRVARWSITYRLALGGSAVLASDLLKLLCRAITGTFRRLPTASGEPLFLLTDDIEGIGTRLARLEAWGEAANLVKDRGMERALSRAAANDPLSHLGVAPDDSTALPPEQLQQLDTALRRRKDLEVAASTLSPALRSAFDREAQEWRKNGHAVRTDRVRLGTDLTCEYVLPDTRAFDTGFTDGMTVDYLARVAVSRTPSPAKPAAAPVSATLPTGPGKRVLLYPLPDNPRAVKELLAMAHRKGFTDIWLRAPLRGPETPARIAAAVTQGKAAGLHVGAAVSWLQRDPGETFGEEERTIQGFTGGRQVQQMVALQPELPAFVSTLFNSLLDGWTVPDASEATASLQKLARVPGLSALVLLATAPPGWASASDSTAALPGTTLGYTLSVRVACIRTEGFDPVDVPDTTRLPGGVPDLPVFPAAGMRSALAKYRFQRNQKEMRRLYYDLRAVAPRLPLYLDDRVSAFTPTDTPWFARWEAPERLPNDTESFLDSGKTRAAARAISSEPLLAYRLLWEKKTEEFLPELVAQATRAQANWRGFVFNIGRDPSPDALRHLAALADIPKAAK